MFGSNSILKLLLIVQSKEGTVWNDQIHVLHISKGGRDKDKERWDVGGPVIPDVQTAVQQYNSTVREMEVRRLHGLPCYCHIL